MNSCSLPSCSAVASFRCSKCKLVYYCSIEHQKLDWKIGHKTECNKTQPNLIVNSHKAVEPQESGLKNAESRECRCMFCGLQMILGSEEEAVNHMKVCPNLQEQISSKEQFVLPSKLKEVLSKTNS